MNLHLSVWLMVLNGVLLASCKQPGLQGYYSGGALVVEELRSRKVLISGLVTADRQTVIGAVGVQRFEGYSDVDKLNKLGAVSFSDSVRFDDNAWYLASVSGGLDYDIDADRRIDDSPTRIFGTVHAIMSGSQLKQGAFALSPLTECAYQFVREYVNLLSDAELGNALTNLAPELLSDVDEDTVLDYGDILSWNRRSAAVFVGDKAGLDSLALAMAMGESQETVQARAMAVTSSKAPSGVALAFYLANIHRQVALGNCLQCHSPGGRASGTRLVLVSKSARNVDAINFTAFAELVAKIGAGAVLHKTRGGEGHEGGRRLIPGSDEFRNFEIFLNML